MAGLATIEAARPRNAATPAQVRMAQAKAAACDHVRQLEAALALAVRLAADVAEGGDAYPAGVRDVCARLTNEVGSRANQIAAITRAH